MKTYLKVPREKGEEVRRVLSSLNLLDTSARIESDPSFVYLPLSNPKARLPFEFPKILMKGHKRESKPPSLQSALAGKLSQKELQELTTSFDIIGDLAILEIPPSLEKKEKVIAGALLTVHKSLKSVAKKESGMQGEFRIRKLKVIAGRKSTKTLYKENGVRMFLDPARMYFSPRLATERKRIALLCKPSEKILALFSGCCPYPLVISRFQPKCKIIAIEKNPEAHKYALENIKLNTAGNITALLGDVRKAIPSKYRNFADRILMPLPKGAEEFLDTAFSGAKKGCVIHLYSFGPQEDPYSRALKSIEENAKKAGRKFKILNKKIVRPYAPGIDQAVIDFQVL